VKSIEKDEIQKVIKQVFIDYEYDDENFLITPHIEKLEKILLQKVTEMQSSTNIRIKKIIHAALYELTAIDEKLRLDPLSIYNPFELNKAINTAFKTTCNMYGISFTEEDLKPEGKEIIERYINLTKENLR
jgi:hypothetical protein